jgi:hypothetical protein
MFAWPMNTSSAEITEPRASDPYAKSAVANTVLTRRVHFATLLGGVFMILAQSLRVPIGRTAVWHNFADLVQTFVRS